MSLGNLTFTIDHSPFTKKKPFDLRMAGSRFLRETDILMKQPGQAIPTEGFHEYSVDCMNTSFPLVKDKNTI
jgi:hypothetical protein